MWETVAQPIQQLQGVSLSGLFVVESLHAGAERGVRSGSGSCDVALQADPAISGTEAKPPACRLRCQDLFPDCPAVGKPVSKTRACGARAQVTRGSRCPTGGLGEYQGSDR